MGAALIVDVTELSFDEVPVADRISALGWEIFDKGVDGVASIVPALTMLVTYTVVGDALVCVRVVCLVNIDEEVAGLVVDGIEVDGLVNVALVFTCVTVFGVDV